MNPKRLLLPGLLVLAACDGSAPARDDLSLAGGITNVVGQGAVALGRSYLPGGYVGAAYAERIAPATGGLGGYRYTVTDGALPPGLRLDESTRRIEGTAERAGAWFFEVTAKSSRAEAAAVYAITISNNPPDGFNLWIASASEEVPAEAARVHLSAALAAWERTIGTELADVVLEDLPERTCKRNAGFLEGARVDDVLALVRIHYDAAGGPLGSGASCLRAETMPKTVVGFISMDAADLAVKRDGGYSLMWHELAHVMGVGDLWLDVQLADSSAVPPVYLGEAAVAEYLALGGGAAAIPVEDQGATGTRLVHWEESRFGTEMMTGYAQVPAPISRMTIASLRDLGWAASFLAAEPYALPCVEAPTCVAPRRPEPEETGWEEAPGIEPVVLRVAR